MLTCFCVRRRRTFPSLDVTAGCCGLLTIDLNNTGSRIHMPQVKPAEMTNLEYQDGGQSAFSMDK